MNQDIGSDTPEMQSNPGKCGLVIQVGPESRSSTGISISATSISHPRHSTASMWDITSKYRLPLFTLPDADTWTPPGRQYSYRSNPAKKGRKTVPFMGGDNCLIQAPTPIPPHICVHTHTHTCARIQT